MSYVDEGHSQRKAARLFKITQRSISKWLKLRDEGKLQPVPVPRHKLFLEPLKAYIDEHPDSTLEEVANHFNCGVKLKHCENLGIHIKKSTMNQRGLLKG